MRRGDDDTSEEVGEGEGEVQEEEQQGDEQGEGALEPSNHLCAGECANGMAVGDQLQGQGKQFLLFNNVYLLLLPFIINLMHRQLSAICDPLLHCKGQ